MLHRLETTDHCLDPCTHLVVALREGGALAGERFLVPLSQRILTATVKLQVIQHGRVQLYLAYVFLTLIALLLWQLGPTLGQ